MAQRATVDTQRARLADRLRPLYPGLGNDEFDQMIARIAEIELHGAGAESVDIGAAVASRRARKVHVRSEARAS